MSLCMRVEDERSRLLTYPAWPSVRGWQKSTSSTYNDGGLARPASSSIFCPIDGTGEELLTHVLATSYSVNVTVHSPVLARDGVHYVLQCSTCQSLWGVCYACDECNTYLARINWHFVQYMLVHVLLPKCNENLFRNDCFNCVAYASWIVLHSCRWKGTRWRFCTRSGWVLEKCQRLIEVGGVCGSHGKILIKMHIFLVLPQGLFSEMPALL